MQIKLALIAIGAAAILGTTVFLMMHRSKTVSSFPPAVIQAYKEWCNDFNKCPPNEDIDLQIARLNTFYDNYKRIEAHNRKGARFSMGINQFMDLTVEEFKATYLGLAKTHTTHVHTESNPIKRDAIDWTTKGVVTGVKDQGQCGSCWAFSSTGGLEGAYSLKNQKLLSFSEQQLVDCSSAQGNMGCNGGLMSSAFEYVLLEGITLEEDYPYTAMDGQCDLKTPVTKFSSYVNITDCDTLYDTIEKGPTSVAVDAVSWQFYSGGIFDDCGTSLDHGVLAVGFDAQQNYKVKNSWGETWGEDGFIRLAAQNTCGICTMASQPSA